MQKQQRMKDVMAPKPVHPTAIRHHGLFGATFAKQHMVVDDQWSMAAIIDEFHGMTNLLSKRLQFKKLEHKAYRRNMYKCARNLRIQCRNGRIKLQTILQGSNVKAIRNHLLNHKEMQRLYQKMPTHLVVDNINQRTFILRKEKDRLEYRMQQLKRHYHMKLLERADIENRIKYENEFVLEEEIRLQEYLEKVEKSKVRLKAIRTINSTYQKVIQVLRHDEIFYEPILCSLSKDLDDQANFIKYILYLGTPAISKFKKLSEEYRLLEDKSRRSTRHTIKSIAGFKKIIPKQMPIKSTKSAHLVLNVSKRYTRETRSMLKLKSELEDIEETIKQIKMATLCSRAKEIFQRFQSQGQSNSVLIKQNDIGEMYHQFLDFKIKVAAEKENKLLHNFSEEESRRLLRIKLLEEQIRAQDAIEADTLAFIKNRADVFVVLRCSLWNLADILRSVGRSLRVYNIKYPNLHLKLPLLKFELHTMRACAPDLFEGDAKIMLKAVETKLRTLMKFFAELTHPTTGIKPAQSTEALRNEYHDNFLASNEIEDQQEEIEGKSLKHEESPFEVTKSMQNVPNRKQIKLQSTKLVDELSKKDD